MSNDRRSTAGPMDFEYTSDTGRTTPAWAMTLDAEEPPRKRELLLKLGIKKATDEIIRNIFSDEF